MLLNNRSDALEKMASQNSAVTVEVKDTIKENAKQIEYIKQSFEFICADIRSVKDKVDHLEMQLAKFQETCDAQKKQLSRLESCDKDYILLVLELANLTFVIVNVCGFNSYTENNALIGRLEELMLR